MKSVLWQGKRALWVTGVCEQEAVDRTLWCCWWMERAPCRCFPCCALGQGWGETRTEMVQEPSEGEEGVCGICLRVLEADWEGESVECRWHLTQGEWQRWRGAESVPLMGELWIISQSKTVVDCLSLGTSRLEASPAGCKIQVQVWNKSSWWSQEISGAALIQELNLGVNYLPVP